MKKKNIEFIKADRKLIDRSKSKEHVLQRTAAYCRVSTSSEDQLNSYKSQVTYYTDLINQNLEWVMAGVYADEAMTGTQATKRESFQKLINDCMNGDIDMVITKSISRFARNTLDTLRYVRMLKEKGVAVYFEDEKINTLTMDGELLLVVLSSVAQQEVENISANVKKGLQMKMKRGELVGFPGCLGYDYDSEEKTLTVNEEEAEIVRYIFSRYIQGVGTHIIATELTGLGYKTKRGNTKWPDSTVLGILKNEKYQGDVLLGKTFTLDPISKRRMRNFGEEDKYYIHDHHEAIVSRDVFEKVQEILLKRGSSRDTVEKNGRRKKYTREYAFSSLLECGFCGGNASRRSWHGSKEHRQVVWQCSVATKKGKKYCTHSKGLVEIALEKAFIESYRLICADNTKILENFLKRIEMGLLDEGTQKRLTKLRNTIKVTEKKRSNLVDMKIDGLVDDISYEEKYTELSTKLSDLKYELEEIEIMSDNEKDIKKRITLFRENLEQNQFLENFDRYVFESIIEKVLIGGVDEDGTVNPYKLTFIYKTGIFDEQDATKFKPARKNAKQNKQSDELSSQNSNNPKNVYTQLIDNTCRVCNGATKTKLLEIVSFKHFFSLLLISMFHAKRL
ncbi:recombinase family protein [Listeria booriae]|uniref:recombinase family protein n=1 Tax=Listeria booriae TaxID=1552123 RepID=UPI00162A86AF|nr:recombinase family protein [Listeria booriae]MBC2259799.1 recombinase family protein [Listeria booriae]